MTEDVKKDFLARPLAVDDAVVFIAPGYRSLVLGRIVSFSPKKVTIEYVNTWNYGKPGLRLQLRQDPDQVTRVDGVDLTMYLLGKA